MSNLFSTPKYPTPPPPPQPAPLPVPTVTPIPTPPPELDPIKAAEQALARRNRGLYGTIATALTGIPEGPALAVNALVPVRKSLFGE